MTEDGPDLRPSWTDVVLGGRAETTTQNPDRTWTEVGPDLNKDGPKLDDMSNKDGPNLVQN